MIPNKTFYPGHVQEFLVEAECQLNRLEQREGRALFISVVVPAEITKDFDFDGTDRDLFAVFDAHTAESGVLRYIFSQFTHKAATVEE